MPQNLFAPQYRLARRTYPMVLVIIALFTLLTGFVRANPLDLSPPMTTTMQQSLPATFDASMMALGTPGTTHRYTHALTNNSTQSQVFNLTASSSQAWEVLVSPATVQLTGGQAETIEVQVTIPSDAPAGSMGLTVLTATLANADLPDSVVVNDTLLVKGQTRLQLPPLHAGRMVNGQRVYTLDMQDGSTEFWPGKQTPTSGYNGTFLGPTLVMTESERVLIKVTNNMTRATTTHWHGFHIPPVMDGGPHQGIAPGVTWEPTFPVLHKAGTMWYHPHPHVENEAKARGVPDGAQLGHQTHSVSTAAPAPTTHHDHHAPSTTATTPSSHQAHSAPASAPQAQAAHHAHPDTAFIDGTGAQVYSGLAGMIIIRDPASNALGLPQRYGVDEFPLIIQDRGFWPDGTFREYHEQNFGYRKGDHFLVNGTLAGNLDVPAQMVRFHIVNGSNARYYNLGFDDNRSFFQIGSDGGLLKAPLAQTRIVVGPGERVELVVDLSADEGQRLNLASFNAELGTTYLPDSSADKFDRANFILFSLRVRRPTPHPVRALPATLNHIPRIDISQAVMTRTFTLNYPLAFNNTPFKMDVVHLTATLGTTEVWSFINQTEDAHPVHIHGDQFQVVARDGAPPPAHEMGWKDTVNVKAGERVDMLVRFSDFADPETPFMFHCHILAHEDGGMMQHYVVVEPEAQCRSGDLDRNGSISVRDIQAIARNFNAHHFPAAHDLDCSGEVNLRDMILAASTWP